MAAPEAVTEPEVNPEEDGPKIEGEAKFDAVEVATGEEDEEVMLKERAKLFLFDAEGNQWKERGTGDVKLLKNKEGVVRILMRRDGTLKICANHSIQGIELKPNVSSDRSWVWSTSADMSEGAPEKQVLAIKFKDVPITEAFKAKVEELQKAMPAAEGEKKEEEK